MALNAGQEKFLNFILEHTQDGKAEDAKKLLAESFGKQADGTFTEEFKNAFIPRMIALLKPEKIEEVKNVMNNFKHPQQ